MSGVAHGIAVREGTHGQVVAQDREQPNSEVDRQVRRQPALDPAVLRAREPERARDVVLAKAGVQAGGSCLGRDPIQHGSGACGPDVDGTFSAGHRPMMATRGWLALTRVASDRVAWVGAGRDRQAAAGPIAVRAGVEEGVGQAGDTDRERVVAGRDTAAAGGDDLAGGAVGGE